MEVLGWVFMLILIGIGVVVLIVGGTILYYIIQLTWPTIVSLFQYKMSLKRACISIIK
jgi:hypothetical protein